MLKHLRITVDGKPYDVVVEDVTEDAGGTLYPAPGSMAQAARVAAPAAAAPAPAAVAAPPVAASGGANDKLAPLGGVILEVVVKVGDMVKAGDKVAVIEAMKMKTVVSAHKDGKVAAVHIKVGDAVEAGQPLVSIE
ncbi:MAG: biotin/lipoyl-binding protein [Rhodospirillales bacterium]|jgi:biotin carboxyl carrier protein|nr:biotin/lipoyl-binding protein [Rhodospirillales bacterium]